MKTFKTFINEIDEGVVKFHDWKKKLPNDLSHIDSTEKEGESRAYKMIHTPDGKKKVHIGTYYHKSNSGYTIKDI